MEEEQVLPRETFLLLKHDREFCRKFEEGLKAGAEDDECYDNDYYDDEYDEEDLYESEEAQLEEMNAEDQSEDMPLPHNPLSM